jgi:hypothetical protein
MTEKFQQKKIERHWTRFRATSLIILNHNCWKQNKYSSQNLFKFAKNESLSEKEVNSLSVSFDLCRNIDKRGTHICNKTT